MDACNGSSVTPQSTSIRLGLIFTYAIGGRSIWKVFSRWESGVPPCQSVSVDKAIAVQLHQEKLIHRETLIAKNLVPLASVPPDC